MLKTTKQIQEQYMGKLYYSISEVSKLIDEEQHILRYWEKEFKQLNPKKNSAGNRKYTKNDIDIIRKIKILLRDEKLSLKGAKEKIDGNSNINSNHNLFESEYATNQPQTQTEQTQVPNVLHGKDHSIKLSSSEAEELKILLKAALKELK